VCHGDESMSKDFHKKVETSSLQYREIKRRKIALRRIARRKPTYFLS
jgi:hypothetical protein